MLLLPYCIEDEINFRKGRMHAGHSVRQLKVECGDIAARASRRTLNKVLNNAGLRSFRAVKAPSLKRINKIKRRHWWQMYRNVPNEFWAKVSRISSYFYVQ